MIVTTIWTIELPDNVEFFHGSPCIFHQLFHISFKMLVGFHRILEFRVYSILLLPLNKFHQNICDPERRRFVKSFLCRIYTRNVNGKWRNQKKLIMKETFYFQRFVTSTFT